MSSGCASKEEVMGPDGVVIDDNCRDHRRRTGLGSMDGATCFQPRIADESLPAKSIHGVFDNWITTSAP
jgi:hypothetical protein